MNSPDFSTTVPVQASKAGYRFSMEPFLLANFMFPEPGDRILDIGTGCGIISHLLLKKQKRILIDAVEIQPTLFQLAAKNLESESDRVHLVQDDFLKWARRIQAHEYDWIVSNPPYRKRNSGRINPDPEKALARHEITLDLESLVHTAVPLLKAGGRLVLSYPDNRLQEVCAQLRETGLQPSRVCRVRGHKEAAPRFFLIEAIKHTVKAPIQEQMFIIYDESRRYTDAMQAVYRSFGFPTDSHRASGALTEVA